MQNLAIFMTFLIFGIIFQKKIGQFLLLKKNSDGKLLPANEKFSKCVANIKSTLIIRPNHKFLHQSEKSVKKFIFFRKISPKNNQKIGGLYVKLSQKILLPG